MYEPSFSRKNIALAISNGSPVFFIGILLNMSNFFFWFFESLSGHMMAPGDTPLTLICGARSLAKDLVSASKPALLIL